LESKAINAKQIRDIRAYSFGNPKPRKTAHGNKRDEKENANKNTQSDTDLESKKTCSRTHGDKHLILSSSSSSSSSSSTSGKKPIGISLASREPRFGVPLKSPVGPPIGPGSYAVKPKRCHRKDDGERPKSAGSFTSTQRHAPVKKDIDPNENREFGKDARSAVILPLSSTGGALSSTSPPPSPPLPPTTAETTSTFRKKQSKSMTIPKAERFSKEKEDLRNIGGREVNKEGIGKAGKRRGFSFGGGGSGAESSKQNGVEQGDSKGDHFPPQQQPFGYDIKYSAVEPKIHDAVAWMVHFPDEREGAGANVGDKPKK